MGQVWFGTRESMRWVPAPAVDIQTGKVGMSASANFLSGGAWVRTSKSGARRFAMSWNMKSRDEVRPILDYADGLYGDGSIYYLNPFAMDKNVLPPYWASPFLNAYDGPVLVGAGRPTAVKDASPSSINGYPVELANYPMTTSSAMPSIFIPVPPGYRLHLGAHGSVLSGSSFVTVRPYTNNTAGSVVNLTLLARTTSTLTNYVSPSNATGVVISMACTTNGTLQLAGLVAQVLPEGSVAPSGGFISGQGQSGMSFVSQPVVSEYSAALDRVGVSVELLETEAWK